MAFLEKGPMPVDCWLSAQVDLAGSAPDFTGSGDILLSKLEYKNGVRVNVFGTCHSIELDAYLEVLSVADPHVFVESTCD